jgi:hypothetical protein
MIIQLTDNDLEKMPPTLCNELLQWLQSMQGKTAQQPLSRCTAEKIPQQLALKIDASMPEQPIPNQSHVRMSQLFDQGLLTESSQVRIRLKRETAKQLGYPYLTGIQVSPKGTLVYEGEEFEKPSPLAAKVNDGGVNGWEYIEIKRDGQWICLDELRKIWRNIV